MNLVEQLVCLYRWIDIPVGILELLYRWLPTPLHRAYSLEMGLGNALDFVLLHQTITGLEAKKQLEKINEKFVSCFQGKLKDYELPEEDLDRSLESVKGLPKP